MRPLVNCYPGGLQTNGNVAISCIKGYLKPNCYSGFQVAFSPKPKRRLLANLRFLMHYRLVLHVFPVFLFQEVGQRQHDGKQEQQHAVADLFALQLRGFAHIH